MGIVVGHYKDPYEPTSIMQCHKGFERCSFVSSKWTEFFFAGSGSFCRKGFWVNKNLTAEYHFKIILSGWKYTCWLFGSFRDVSSYPNE